jgi:hypothetical protein
MMLIKISVFPNEKKWNVEIKNIKHANQYESWNMKKIETKCNKRINDKAFKILLENVTWK